MRRRTVVFAIVGLLVGTVLLASGLVVASLMSAPRMNYTSIEEAVRASSSKCGPLQFSRDVGVVVERRSLRARVVVYKGMCVSWWGGKDLMYGYVTVEGGGVRPGAWSRAQDLAPEQLAEMSYGGACEEDLCEGDALVRVLSPDVEVVEVVYADGRVDRAEPTEGLFASVGMDHAREVRLIDATGRVIRRF